MNKSLLSLIILFSLLIVGCAPEEAPEAPSTLATEELVEVVPEDTTCESIVTEPSVASSEPEKIEDTEPTEPPITIKFTECYETVYAIRDVNVRTGPSTAYKKIGALAFREPITRIGEGANGWDKIIFDNQEAYVAGNYLSKTKPEIIKETEPPTEPTNSEEWIPEFWPDGWIIDAEG